MPGISIHLSFEPHGVVLSRTQCYPFSPAWSVERYSRSYSIVVCRPETYIVDGTYHRPAHFTLRHPSRHVPHVGTLGKGGLIRQSHHPQNQTTGYGHIKLPCTAAARRMAWSPTNAHPKTFCVLLCMGHEKTGSNPREQFYRVDGVGECTRDALSLPERASRSLTGSYYPERSGGYPCRHG